MYLKQNNKLIRPSLTLSLAVALACATSQASADSNTLESILVTADRQQSELRDIASSIFAVDSESLEKVSHVHINEILARVPGTWVSRGNGQEHLTAIRSPVLTGAGSCGAFQMSQDGIPLRAAGFCNANQLFESNSEQAGSIEVIRGPGSVLYGSNALHGTINVISPEVSEELSGDFSLEAGLNSYGRVKTSVSSTEGRHGVRVNFNGTTDGGYKDDSGFDQQKLGLLHKYSGTTYTISSGLDVSNLNQETAGYLYGEDAYKDEDRKRDNSDPEAFRDARSYRLHSRIEWETDEGNWMVTPYYRNTEMEFLMHFLPGAPVEENGQESLGLQTMYSTNSDGNLQWLAGVDFEFTEGYLRQTQDGGFSIFPEGKQYDYEVDAEMISPFAQLKYQFTEQDQLTFGLRYESLNYDYNNLMITGRTMEDGVPCAPRECRYSRPADRSDSFDNVSAQVGWVHDFDENQQLYVNLSHAFRAPQATEMYRLQNEQTVADLDSEEVESIDVGYRASRERMSYGASVFYMQKDNVIFQDSERNNVSGAETEHKGVEFNAAYAITEQLSLTFAGSYARHTYASDVGTLLINGNEIDTAPKLTSSAQLNWQIDEKQSVELEWIHMGSYYTNETNLNKYDGHELLNLRYQTDFADNWFFAARVTNLLDTDYAERADFSGFGGDRYFVGEPVSLYLTVGSRF